VFSDVNSDMRIVSESSPSRLKAETIPPLQVKEEVRRRQNCSVEIV
jgi:hypothetical protein